MSAKVMVALTVAADPDAAFVAFTAEVDLWWRRGPQYRFGRDGRMRFAPGPDGCLAEDYPDGSSFVVGRILAWEPGRRLAFEWRNPNYVPDEHTRVEIRFSPAAGGTRVVVEHSGWEGLGRDHPARHGLADVPVMRMMGDWWRGQLAALSEWITR